MQLKSLLTISGAPSKEMRLLREHEKDPSIFLGAPLSDVNLLLPQRKSPYTSSGAPSKEVRPSP